ncbi:hypothetical protein K491DRAFT_768492 [Lophiostoma macrostomum CBS 122681]|uniref:Alpha/beta-hydrolase n=1 Tax=Lophiostoma macrostomum CBS 122681 TaxID=1314788 RepID=A0A6A6T601_9PLEO|nr:hypothetical protein K491DRAFT_768492 [Lophiostoma macrostomum CBS 122681]
MGLWKSVPIDNIGHRKVARGPNWADVTGLGPSTNVPDTFDHENKPVTHGTARADGIRLHYITAGSGPALFLLHGTPKNHYYYLRHERFAVHSEVRGATFGYCLAGHYSDRVTHLSFCEMVLSDSLTKQIFFTQSNIGVQFEQKGVWNWQLSHDSGPSSWKPNVKIPPRILETYRAHWTNADVEAGIKKKGKLKCPVTTVGALVFFGPLVAEQMETVAENVVISGVFQ